MIRATPIPCNTSHQINNFMGATKKLFWSSEFWKEQFWKTRNHRLKVASWNACLERQSSIHFWA
jgi:hypothetical protein